METAVAERCGSVMGRRKGGGSSAGTGHSGMCIRRRGLRPFAECGAPDPVRDAQSRTRLAIRCPHAAPDASTPLYCCRITSATGKEARQVTIPLHVLLQWEDEGNDRQIALDPFDAFGSEEKTLHANIGEHTGVPQLAGEAANRFFTWHPK